MNGPELCYLTAAQAIRRVTDNSLSPVELEQTLSAGGAATEAPVNAFSEPRSPTHRHLRNCYTS